MLPGCLTCWKTVSRDARYTPEIITRIQEPLKGVVFTDIDINAFPGDMVLKKRNLWNTSVSLIQQFNCTF